MAEEARVVLELTEKEVKEMLGTAVQQMVRIANEPAADLELQTLASVIHKCSKATKSIGVSSEAQC